MNNWGGLLSIKNGHGIGKWINFYLYWKRDISIKYTVSSINCTLYGSDNLSDAIAIACKK
jgi:hypothetical protein